MNNRNIQSGLLGGYLSSGGDLLLEAEIANHATVAGDQQISLSDGTMISAGKIIDATSSQLSKIDPSSKPAQIQRLLSPMLVVTPALPHNSAYRHAVYFGEKTEALPKAGQARNYLPQFVEVAPGVYRANVGKFTFFPTLAEIALSSLGLTLPTAAMPDCPIDTLPLVAPWRPERLIAGF